MKHTMYTSNSNKISVNETIEVKPYGTKWSPIPYPLMIPVLTYNNETMQIEYYCSQDLGCY